MLNTKVDFKETTVGKQLEAELNAIPASELAEEYCPHCSGETRIKAEFKVQQCEYCGERILPCSLCEKQDCKNCPFEKEAQHTDDLADCVSYLTSWKESLEDKLTDGTLNPLIGEEQIHYLSKTIELLHK